MRQLSKILLLLLFVVCELPLLCPAQLPAIAQAKAEINIDSLQFIYGRHKHFIKEYELQSLLALSYYPELANTAIRFKYRRINSSAQTTMTLGSIFKKAGKKYIIYLNKDTARTGMILSDAPFEAQIAVLGHELSHVTDFKSRGFFDLALFALRYLFVKQSTKIERSTDKNTIEHGLGWPLYQWAEYFINKSNANKHYRKMRQRKYLHPYEILAYMESLNMR